MPRGMRQKSAIHAGGVGRFVRSSEDDILEIEWLYQRLFVTLVDGLTSLVRDDADCVAVGGDL